MPLHIPMDIKEALAESGYTQDEAGVECYLKDLAEDYGVPFSVVVCLYTLHGVEELFDGLVTAVEDAVDTFGE